MKLFTHPPEPSASVTHLRRNPLVAVRGIETLQLSDDRFRPLDDWAGRNPLVAARGIETFLWVPATARAAATGRNPLVAVRGIETWMSDTNIIASSRL